MSNWAIKVSFKYGWIISTFFVFTLLCRILFVIFQSVQVRYNKSLIITHFNLTAFKMWLVSGPVKTCLLFVLWDKIQVQRWLLLSSPHWAVGNVKDLFGPISASVTKEYEKAIKTKGQRSKRQLFYPLRWLIYVSNSVVSTKLPAIKITDWLSRLYC